MWTFLEVDNILIIALKNQISWAVYIKSMIFNINIQSNLFRLVLDFMNNVFFFF